ncbi:MAG: hypothetical protein ACRD04_02965 [Terriglobales bacterium]
MLWRLTAAGLLAAGLCVGAAGQRLQAPPPPGPRPNVQPNPALAKNVEPLVLPESKPLVLPKPDPLLAGHDLSVGNFYYRRGEYAGALARFDDAIYHQPALAEAYCRAGDTEWKLHRYPAARSEWGRCLGVARSGKWAQHARHQLQKHRMAGPPA